jgi:Uma2 family endonuclease
MELIPKVFEVKDINEITYTKEREKPMPSLNHAHVQTALAVLLFKYRKKYTVLTELSLELSQGSGTPDLALIESTPPDWSNDQIKYKEPPLLTIEILSPKQSLDDLKDKIKNVYFPSGVQSAWIVLPTLRAITIFKKNGTNETFTKGILKDLVLDIEVDLAEIFG